MMILVRERWGRERNFQAQKSAACRRLATAAVITEQAWDKDRQQAAEKVSGHQEREENMKTALGCGKTFVFDPAEASNFGAEVCATCRPWGGLVWRWLNIVPFVK